MAILGVTMIYNAALSPTLNPIELVFNAWKHEVRETVYFSLSELVQSVVKASLHTTGKMV